MKVLFGVADPYQLSILKKIKLEDFDELRVDLDIRAVIASDVVFFIRDDTLEHVEKLVDGEMESEYQRNHPHFRALQKYMKEQAADRDAYISHGEIETGDIIVGVFAYKKQMVNLLSTGQSYCELGQWFARYLYKAKDNICHYVEPVIPVDGKPESEDFTWL